MNTANKVRTTFEKKGQQLLLLTLMLLIFAGPFMTEAPAMGWLSSIILMTIVLAAAYTVSSRGKGFLVTLFTLGYGDISPVKPHAMTASYVLANLGQLYLAILVARLVSLYIGRPGRREH